MPRRSRLAWRIARHLCCVQGNKCPLFSPIRMIRLSLDVLRKNRPLALLSDVLPYGKCKPQEIAMALHHFRQGLAPARFSKPVKNRFSLPNFIFYPIFSQCCTTPMLFLLKLKCFPPLLPFSTPRQACHLLYICILQATASNQKDQAFHVLLSTRGVESNMLKGGTSSWQGTPKWDGCEAEGTLWECSGGSTWVQKTRGQSDTWRLFRAKSLLKVNAPLQSPKREQGS